MLKSAFTDQAFHGASECLQVFGGHGYVREWGVEQVVRDARITMIYEGTNEIQAIDLLVRKVLPDGGKAITALLLALRADLDTSDPVHADLLRRIAELRYITTRLVDASRARAELAYEAADDYLRAVGVLMLAWAWTRILRSPGTDTPRWQNPARALRERVLPEFDMRLKMMQELCGPLGGAAVAHAGAVQFQKG